MFTRLSPVAKFYPNGGKKQQLPISEGGAQLHLLAIGRATAHTMILHSWVGGCCSDMGSRWLPAPLLGVPALCRAAAVEEIAVHSRPAHVLHTPLTHTDQTGAQRE